MTFKEQFTITIGEHGWISEDEKNVCMAWKRRTPTDEIVACELKETIQQ